MRKPATMAASSAQAFTRHQNQRRMSTAPGPVPMAIISRKTVPMSSAWKAATPATATMSTEATRPRATRRSWEASGCTKRW